MTNPSTTQATRERPVRGPRPEAFPPRGEVGSPHPEVETEPLLDSGSRPGLARRAEILVVEDEPAVTRMLGVALAPFGFTVRLALGGREAVEFYRQHHRALDLVLLDVQMRGLDGPQTLLALREINPEVRCCFMSGHTGKYSAQDLLALGAAHVFPKPFASLDELAGVLWQVVSAS